MKTNYDSIILCDKHQRPKHTNWKELRSFAFEDVKNPTMESTTKWCQPFPFDVPNFPLQSSGGPSTSSQVTLDPTGNIRDPYIPEHLPPFPPAHTFKRSASSRKRAAQQQLQGEERDNGVSRKSRRSSTIKSAQGSLAAIEDSIDSSLRTV